MKKVSIVLIVLAAVIFVIAFIIGSNLDFFVRIIFSAVISAVGTLYFWSSGSRKSVQEKDVRKSAPKNLYIYPITKQSFKYRIENGKIYKGYDNHFAYRIEGNKIYKGMDASPVYSVEGNKVYQFMGNRTPLYRVEKDKIYEGDFGVIPIYEIKDRPVK